MPKTRLIALNGNGGPLVAVLSTGFARRVTAREDEAAAATGIQYVRGDDTTSTLNTVGTPGTPDQQQIDINDNMQFGSRAGKLQGMPQQNSAGSPFFRAADTYFKAQGKGAGATTLRVIEYE
jgi:hypothetical protein